MADDGAAPSIPDDEPRLVLFLLTLPDAVPVPSGTTWHRSLPNIREPLLDGVAFQPTADAPVIEDDGPGINYVSMRFWQVPRPGGTAIRESFEASAKVMQHLLGRDEEAPPSSPAMDMPETMTTVVEAVTFAASADAMRGTPDREDALTRCINVLVEQVRAYRIATQAPIPELTYERLHLAVPWMTRPALGDVLPEPAGIIILETNVPAVPTSELLEQESLEIVASHHSRLIIPDPFLIYAERRLEGRVALRQGGRHSEAVLQMGIASEVLLSAVLGLALYEEHLAGERTVEQVAEVLSTDLTPRLRNEYHARFGGNWSLRNGVMGAWYSDIATVRNRVVHSGHRPDREVADKAWESLMRLEKHVGDRLAAKVTKYPRLAWCYLGTGGFERRGRLRAAQAAWDSIGGEPVVWLREYEQWRQGVDVLVERRRKK